MDYLRRTIQIIYNKPHLLYLIIALATTGLFAIITPPFNGPDEDVHFFRAYQIAQGHIVLEHDSNNNLGTCLSSEIYSTVVNTSLTPNIRGVSSSKYNKSQIKSEIFKSVGNPSNCRFVSTTNTYSYNPLSYTPAVIGVGIVNIFDGPPLLAMYLARAITAIVAVMISALAIRLLPRKKYMFVVILLTPMLLYQQSVISTDGLSYALLALFVAYLVRVYNKDIITRDNWIYLLVMAILLCCMKPLLFMFVPLVLLLLPVSKLKSIGIVFACSVIVLITMGITSSLYPNVTTVGAAGSNPELQVDMLEQKPLRAVRVAWNTYMSPYGDGQTEGVVGLFGYADTKIPLWLYSIAIINIVLAVVLIPKDEILRRVKKQYNLGIVAVALLYFVAVNAAMYITYSPVDSSVFYGVQGRYFLPILIALPLLSISGLVIGKADYKRLKLYLILSTTIILLLCIFVLFQRYYLYTP